MDIPTLGNLLIGAILVASAYTFAISIVAARGRPQLVEAARWGIFATVAFTYAAVFLLAYAFQSHDFRLRYIEHYSDRSMSPGYLWTALWGGQDGSLLWWCFLLGGYSLGFTLWAKHRYLELQPWVYATLANVFSFFAVLMLFAANPFAVTHGPAPADGQGLNPLLQNYWMAIHPPALYMGLTGWAIPFGICVAALVTGRLGDEWIFMARRWVLLAWSFLTLGNMLGMFWSYEELGWGGYWAWDPVENASFMPWLFATAYLHSVMIQERRGMMKVWNVSLLCGTFWLTIFGTFLTRSGMIASVHSFARSDIGIYFVYYMVFIGILVTLLIAWRLPELRGRLITLSDLTFSAGVSLALGISVVLFTSDAMLAVYVILVGPVLVGLCAAVERLRVQVTNYQHRPRHVSVIENMLSREFAFLLNNWILVGMLAFIMIATTYPLLSEALRGETVTVGPAHYNWWMIPQGLMLLFLMGVGPLIAWRKATGRNLAEAFIMPLGVAAIVAIGHFVFGPHLGIPATVWSEPIYDTDLGRAIAPLHAAAPVMSTTLCAFVLATIVQEFARGTMVRARNAKENIPTALVRLVSRARRRYGGYIVHLGVVMMYLGFTGAAYDVENERSLLPGQTMDVGGYTFRYDQVREDVDLDKTMRFADLSLIDGGRAVLVLSPGKFVYRSNPEMPTTEVAIHSSPLNDIYAIFSSVDLETGRATFRVIVRPAVLWIWLGGFVLLLGTFVSAFPSLKEILGEADEPARRRPMAVPASAAAAAIFLAIAVGAGHAHAQDSSSLHAGTVTIHDPVERQLFERLLCMCGGCQRLPLSSCACGWADEMRADLRDSMARGRTVTQIQDDYRARFGAAAIAIPGDSGLDRALWAVPLTGIMLALLGILALGRHWRERAGAIPSEEVPGADAVGKEYDARIEAELRKLEEP